MLGTHLVDERTGLGPLGVVGDEGRVVDPGAQRLEALLDCGQLRGDPDQFAFQVASRNALIFAISLLL